MSNLTYEQQLREAMVDLREQLTQDEKFKEDKIPKDKMQQLQFFMQNWSAMYIRYLQVFRKLEDCYDQILQPQKRADVRVILDSCIGRMLELKFQIVSHCGEYVNYDDVLVDLKLTPDVLEIPIPKYFLEERKRELEERNKLLSALIQAYGQQQAKEESDEGLPKMTKEQAIAMLQCNERGRQGRQRTKFMKEIHGSELRERQALEFGTSAVTEDPQEAATKIQKIFKGFLARKETERMRREELEFLGMEETRIVEKEQKTKKLSTILDRRKLIQVQNQQELDQERIAMRQRIKDLEGGKIMEDMHDLILEKIITLRQAADAGQIPEFPTEEEGGSYTFLQDKPELTEEEKMAEEERKKKEAEALAKGKKGKGGKDAKKGAAKKGGKKGKKGEEEDDEKDEEIKESKFWLPFGEGTHRYVDVWQERFDNLDFGQKYDKGLLRESIMEGSGGLMAELRNYVDALVRVELTNLRAALERDKQKKPGKGKKGGKPKGGKKGGKGKGKKDLTEGKKIESLVNELVWTGFLQQCPKVKVKDYLGAHNLMGTVMEEAEKVQQEQIDDVQRKWKQVLDNWTDAIESSFQVTQDQFRQMFEKWVEQRKAAGFVLFEPSMSQVRQAVTEYGVLPLGSKVVHDLAPHHKSMLLYGPASSGKTMLTHAIVTESGSNYFNLSPQNLQDKYNNAKAVQLLLHMIFKVAKSMAPSVIYIDQADLVFSGGKGKKKKKSPDGGKAARIKKDLLQQMKELEHSDRVLVVGNSRNPFDADIKELLKFFSCMVYCPLPDYASRVLIWQQLVAQRGAKMSNDYDLEILAYMTNKYASGTIHRVVHATLSDRRVKRLNQRVLTAEEFLGPLSKQLPVFKEDFENLKQFTLGLPFHMRKRRTADFEKDDEEEEGGKKGGKKGKK
mmetsp:Transcript_153261/g.267789  ORF Transcript_153261/g.267789 Transcript_153261/m.267789 type:complete len:902 (-) Transcript_153261:616-3321(-)